MGQKKISVCCAIILPVILISGCGSLDRPYLRAPTDLPNTGREMKTSGFWISRHPDPDRIVMSGEEIGRFNQRVQGELKLTRDLRAVADPFSGSDLRSTLEQTWLDVRKENYRRRDGRFPGERFYNELNENIDLPQTPSAISVRYGLVFHYGSQRVLPTREILTKKARDIDFDELQNSSFDIGTPIVVLKESADGQWVYAIAELSLGWLAKEDVVLVDRAQWEEFLAPRTFAVATAAKSDLFLDVKRSIHIDHVRMGTRLPLVSSKNADLVEVLVPGRREDGRFVPVKAFMGREDVSIGYLSYTPRNAIVQSFKLLNEPYGWGGMYGEQDCSAFLVEIFSTFGIILPRNSGQQDKTGRILQEFDDEIGDELKLEVLKQAIGGITLLPMKGHIMLYLGQEQGRPYAIHATWGYRDKHNRMRVINRVAVSDLWLGEGTKKGSHLRRIKSVNMITP